MKNYYLINEIVIFSPENCTLTPKSRFPGGKVTLHGPASECLHILLSHNHQPVMQKRLFEQVWQRKGIVVSTNTLYQSIASIRKGLKAAGLEEEIIRTLPRQGFQCNATVEVGEITTLIPPEAETENSVLPEPKPDSPLSPHHLPGYALFLSCALALAMVGGLIYWPNFSTSPISPEYYPAGTIEHCTLYSSWSGEEYSQAVFLNLRQRHPINCSAQSQAYLTVNRLQLQSSLILCTEKISSETTKCRTIIFKDDDEIN